RPPSPTPFPYTTLFRSVCQSFRLNGQSTFIEPAAFLNRCGKARVMPGDGLMSDPRVEGPVSQGNDALRRFNASGAMLVGLVTVRSEERRVGKECRSRDS